jgi:hypothetical protein
MFAVFIDQVSPRIYYVLEELFARRLHCELKIYTDQEHYKADSSPFKIQYVTAENTDLPGFVVIRDPFMLEEQVTLYFTPRVGHFFLSPRAQYKSLVLVFSLIFLLWVLMYLPWRFIF